ncbi:MAG: glycosyltransferase family 4 protein [Bacteroidales bacterium]|nr:glycosyltransferase family 4 protein [Candidatus Latescibacterota bacterium]
MDNITQKCIQRNEVPAAAKPRILQISASDITITKLLFPLMHALRFEGYDVECAANDLEKGTVSRIESVGFRFHNIDIRRNLSPANLYRGFMNILELLKRERFDIVHFHTPVAAFIGRLAAGIAGQENILYTAHGFYFHENMPWFKRFIFKFAEKIAGRFATDFMFCQSIEDTDWAAGGNFISPSRVLHIGNGADISHFNPDIELGSKVRKELGIDTQTIVLTFIGRIVKEKGILDLAESFRSLSSIFPNTILLVAGDCETSGDRDTTTLDRLKSLIRVNQMENRVKLLGFRNDPERILAASDIFVLPSYREGLPRSICEAMACGVPVIASRIRGCREEVTDGIDGILFEAGNNKALTEALGILISERGKRVAMGEMARKKALQHFDERKVLDRQLRVFRSLIPPHSDPPEKIDVMKEKSRESLEATPVL